MLGINKKVDGLRLTYGESENFLKAMTILQDLDIIKSSERNAAIDEFSSLAQRVYSGFLEEQHVHGNEIVRIFEPREMRVCDMSDCYNTRLAFNASAKSPEDSKDLELSDCKTIEEYGRRAFQFFSQAVIDYYNGWHWHISNPKNGELMPVFEELSAGQGKGFSERILNQEGSVVEVDFTRR
jgi:hypothetical protein